MATPSLDRDDQERKFRQVAPWGNIGIGTSRKDGRSFALHIEQLPVAVRPPGNMKAIGQKVRERSSHS